MPVKMPCACCAVIMNDEYRKRRLPPTKKKNAALVTPANETKATESEMNIPDYAIERLARCMLPLIQKYYESEEGKEELRNWKNT